MILYDLNLTNWGVAGAGRRPAAKFNKNGKLAATRLLEEERIALRQPLAGRQLPVPTAV
jgi:hypothetical protein